MPGNFTLFQLLIVFAVTTLGALLQGALGYGMALVTAPILLLIDPHMIPGSQTLVAFFLIVLITLRDHQALDLTGWRWGMLGLIGGLVVGTVILAHFPRENYGLIFGVLILFAVLLSVSGLRPPYNPITLLLAGLLSGVMGILSTTAGPPLALVYQDAPGKRVRATLSSYFIVGAAFAMLSLATIGRFGWLEIRLAGLLLPGTLLGFLASSRLVHWVDRGYTRPAVLILAGISAFVVIINQFY